MLIPVFCVMIAHFSRLWIYDNSLLLFTLLKKVDKLSCTIFHFLKSSGFFFLDQFSLTFLARILLSGDVSFSLGNPWHLVVFWLIIQSLISLNWEPGGGEACKSKALKWEGAWSSQNRKRPVWAGAKWGGTVVGGKRDK